MAWWNATPKPPKGSKRAAADAGAKLSRVEQAKKDGMMPVMPPKVLPHIIDWWTEMGISEAQGMGAAPLSWKEINAWCERTCIDLTPWEGRVIKRMSVDYLAEARRAEAETCPPPWHVGVSQHERDREAALLRSVLG